MERLKELITRAITEGVFDPAIFKAVFMAGGSGSGKGFIASKVTAGHGLRVVNSDDFLTFLLRKAGLGLDLAKIPKAKLTPIRTTAKKLTGKKRK